MTAATTTITPRLLAVSVAPQEFDVLCSKDKTHSAHRGNKIFRERIEFMKETYRQTKNKQGKMEITKDIVRYLKETHASRFLKRNGAGVWAEISDQAARDKVSHALRFATRRDTKSEQLNGRSKSQEAILEHHHHQHHLGMEVTTSTETTAVVEENNPQEQQQVEPKSTNHPLVSPTVCSAPKASATGGTTATNSSVYCGVIPEEHIEPSKWLLALRQGS
eukprot:CAMPEP_0198141322 /NCGR_PEP_ID=MMETSP1443-20131203/4355_1 /TAXON_ID=186043 /ORGANISM="Entomoneis sp., Strain CCMP2396" /LENGTH=219 /DNA_ID=CAMNT_0043804043 /DNA_START=37 /DNA_END=696 /DNA_ORIENTATION=+